MKMWFLILLLLTSVRAIGQNSMDSQRDTINFELWDLHTFFTTADLRYTLQIVRDGEVKQIKIKNANYKTLWQ